MLIPKVVLSGRRSLLRTTSAVTAPRYQAYKPRDPSGGPIANTLAATLPLAAINSASNVVPQVSRRNVSYPYLNKFRGHASWGGGFEPPTFGL